MNSCKLKFSFSYAFKLQSINEAYSVIKNSLVQKKKMIRTFFSS